MEGAFLLTVALFAGREASLLRRRERHFFGVFHAAAGGLAMVLLPSVGRYPDLLFGFLACRDGLHCCGRLRCCSSAITARQSRRAAQNAQAEGQCRRNDSEFFLHLLFSFLFSRADFLWKA